MIRDTVEAMSPVFDVSDDPPEVLRHLPIRGRAERYSVSPDGRRVVFTTVQRDAEGYPTILLYCLVLPSRRLRLLEEATDNEAPEIARWSPDSRRILFWRIAFGVGSANADGVPLFDVAADGGKPRRLTPRLWKYGDRILRYRSDFIVFSPDGRRLLLVQGGSRFEVENKRLVCRNNESGQLLWMSEPEMAATQPVWSPDGRQIAYIANPDRQGLRQGFRVMDLSAQQHLWVRGADGQAPRRLTIDPRFREAAPRWALGGRTIRFERDDNADRGPKVAYRTRRSLWEIHPNGAGLKKVRDLPPDPPRD